MTRYQGRSLSQALASADSRKRHRNIYAPILYYAAAERPHIIYGGWESSVWPPTDRIYQMDADLDDPGPNTLTTHHNGRLILQSDPADPTMYHINAPSLIDLGACHYRLYFEVETLNVGIRSEAHVNH